MDFDFFARESFKDRLIRKFNRLLLELLTNTAYVTIYVYLFVRGRKIYLKSDVYKDLLDAMWISVYDNPHYCTFDHGRLRFKVVRLVRLRKSALIIQLAKAFSCKIKKDKNKNYIWVEARREFVKDEQ